LAQSGSPLSSWTSMPLTPTVGFGPERERS
jgi:hypothetical protein